MQIAAVIFIAVLAISSFGIVAGILWAVVAGFRMMWHFKDPSDAYSRKTLWNPMNALIIPDLLTPKGLALRRQVGIASLTSVICGAIAFFLALLTHIGPALHLSR